ncbi:hypothetical protein C8Q80DRAFT_1218295 [Daedaleopsis nitida]|nr:hypothetical protein C8Q80DRAFT_1218295 [Daedaleopsis nitida]
MEGKTSEELLCAAATLIGTSRSSDIRPADLKSVLWRRLSEYYTLIGGLAANEDASLEDMQLETAKEALNILEHLHRFLIKHEPDPSSATRRSTERDLSLLGTRDLSLVRTLFSVAFKWALEPLLQRIIAAIPSTSTSEAVAGARIIDLTGLPHEFSTLSSMTSRMLALPFKNGTPSPLAQSAVTATLLNHHLPDLLLPCVILGWLPQSLASDSVPTAGDLRPQVMYLLSRLPASQAISAVGQTLSTAPPSLPYARKTCTFILSRQLMRPEGIRGLCESVFAEEDVSGEDASLDKLEHVARLLTSVPPAMKAEDYCKLTVPRMLLLLSVDDRLLPPAHRRAIAFSLSRMLTQNDNSTLQRCTSTIALEMLHGPILQGTGDITVSASLRTVRVLLTNTDPSPDLISTLFTPIVPSLYALHSHLEGAKASDPVLRESLKGFLETWARLVGSSEVVATIWQIVNGEGGSWRVDVAGEISRSHEVQQDDPSLSLFTPESLREAEEADELDVDSNILGLKPDPVRLVQFIRNINRGDVSSELFVKLLEGYRELRNQSEADADPMRTLLYLQLILQMQKQLSTDDPSNNDLRIVEDEPDDVEGDSDDEEPDSGAAPTADDMTTTSVKLLLAVLEANPDLSARTAPALNDIFSLLEPLSRNDNEELCALAREARMVMTARLASSPDPTRFRRTRSSSGDGDTESAQETYQKALKLLQDPLLPVRAHGLLLLRQLVAARTPGAGAGNRLSAPAPVLDRALVPGILAIFMQSVQDDDSYMFLNAVQGLAAMVDGYGRDVLRELVKTYVAGVDGVGGAVMERHDVDVRTRVGEALGQVVRRCAEALPSYASLLVPPLFQVIRASHFPTVLRTSAISLLAQCVKVNALAVLPYLVDLADAMVDLLQVESVQATPQPASSARSDAGAEGEGAVEAKVESEGHKPQTRTMDTHPSSTNAKLPPLRRAALHFLSLLVRACTARVYETGGADGFLLPPAVMKRTKTTLGYIAVTDADDIVRIMARETAEGLDQLAEAVVGL